MSATASEPKPLALIIEDSKDLAVALKIPVEEAGFTTEHISDGKAAMQRLNEVVPALLVLDLDLPFVSGEVS